MKSINYIKPPANSRLFEKLDKFNFTTCQNYQPIYELFFTLSPQNYNTIHLNHKFHIVDILDTKTSTNQHYVFEAVIQDCNAPPVQSKNNGSGIKQKGKSKPQVLTTSTFKKNIFVKLSSLLDPFAYITGKYLDAMDGDVIELNRLTQLLPQPKCVLDTNSTAVPESKLTKNMEKMLDVNNTSYVDGFFSFLSNQLLESFGFMNGIRYYGSFVSCKKNFMFNIADDLEYLVNSKFFNNHQNKLFQVEDYSHLIEVEEPKPKLNFDNLQQLGHDSILDVDVLDLETFAKEEEKPKEEDTINGENDANKEEIQKQLEEIYNHEGSGSEKHSSTGTRSTGTSISSRSSKSSVSEENNLEQKEDVVGGKNDYGNNNSEKSESECEDDDYESGSEDDGDEDEEEQIYATLSQFPVQLICIEQCEQTLSDYLDSTKISQKEWLAIFMQIIMTLIVYQKAFQFTHNDLHTNNIMYVRTKQKFICYRYKNQIYRVPTFGKIYKIIDFGRAIFNYKGHRLCSDSFKKHGDAHSQYNTEPYFDESKRRIEPNYSFDLCRLACTLFDDLLDVDFDEECSITELVKKTTNPVAKIVADWCLCDDGKNVLYKDNGDERYPDFKLYKMIARRVHRHTPDAQLSRPEFSQFRFGGVLPKDVRCINIDAIQVYA